MNGRSSQSLIIFPTFITPSHTTFIFFHHNKTDNNGLIKDGCPLPFNAQNESTLDKNILAGLWANDNLLCLIFVNQQEHWVLIGFTVVVTPNYFQRVFTLGFYWNIDLCVCLIKGLSKKTKDKNSSVS